MRLHQPLSALDALERFLAEPGVAEAVAARHVLPAREADLRAAARVARPTAGARPSSGVASARSTATSVRPSTRSTTAEDIAIVTPTASGKSLCYNLPVLQAICRGPGGAGALPVPDQGAEPGPAGGVPRPRRAGRDGPVGGGLRRRHARRPSGPSCARPGRSWSPTRTCSAPRSCRTTPSGSSSSSSCATSSSTRSTPTAASSAATWPTCCGACCASAPTTARTRASSAPRPRSATPASWPRRSPAGPSGSSTGAAHPRASGTWSCWTRPRSTRAAVSGPGPIGLAYRAALSFLRAGRQTIVFGRARVAVELLLASLREAMREGRGPIERIRGYRGGYLPSERRAIERGLRSGEVLGVVSTNALELGIDIGAPRRLHPGRLSRAPSPAPGSRWAAPGRRQETSVSILVAGAGAARSLRRHAPGVPLRGHARGGPPRPGEPARPAGPPARGHVRAALRTRARPSARAPADDLLAFLAEEGHVRQADDGRWYWASENFPASEINLRLGAPENVLIIDTGPGAAARARRGRPLRRPRPGPREGHLPARLAAVPRRRARLGGAQGAGAPGRLRLLHAGRAGRDAQAARGLRRGDRARPAAASTARS